MRFFISLVVMLGVCGCCQETSASDLGQPTLSGPSVALEGAVEYFQCEVTHFPKGEAILLQLFREPGHSKALGVYTSLKGERMNIPLLVKSSYEGDLVCVASLQNHTDVQPTVSHTHHLRVVVPVEEAEIHVTSDLREFHQGRPLSLHCGVYKGTHVSYHWLVDGRSPPLHDHAQKELFISRPTPQDSGAYMCVATNNYNHTQVYIAKSEVVNIKVKELVSDPDISFTVRKEESGTYSAIVSCQSSRGALPATFSLYNSSKWVATQTVDQLNATFILPVVLERPGHRLQCRGENGEEESYSRWMDMEVVRVGGPVAMRYDYDIGRNFAVVGLTLYCSVGRGTFPRYLWFLNTTVLEGRGTFYWVVHQPPDRSILLLSVGRSSAGTYRCEVSDSFDNTTARSSQELYIDKEGLNRLRVVVVAVVLSCFLFLLGLVTACLCMGLVYSRRQYSEKSLMGLEMDSMMVADDDELDEEEYMEDVDVVRAARTDEPDSGSVESTGEWPQMEEALRLKTMEEDVPVEKL